MAYRTWHCRLAWYITIVFIQYLGIQLSKVRGMQAGRTQISLDAGVQSPDPPVFLVGGDNIFFTVEG